MPSPHSQSLAPGALSPAVGEAAHTPWRAKGEHVYGSNGLPLFNAGTPENAAFIIRACNSHATLAEALAATEARLTRVANAFYVSGKRSDLQAALDGWKADAHQARAALSLAKQ